VRREVFEALGGFDERFFVYYEDLDFSLRVRDAGWRVLYVASARGVHRGGWATGRGRSVRLYHDWRSRVAFARKHFGPRTAAMVTGVTILVDPIARCASGLRHGSWAEIADLAVASGCLLLGRAPAGDERAGRRP
jgi:GT2 family glycosyltransferase